MKFEIRDLNSLRSIDELRAYQGEVKERISELNTEFAGLPFPDDVNEEWTALGEQTIEIDGRVAQLETRNAFIREQITTPPAEGARRVEGMFQVPTILKSPDNVFDLAGYRQRASSIDQLPALYFEGAKRVLDMVDFPTMDPAKARGDIMKLLATVKGDPGEDARGIVARRIVGTGSPAYAAAWARYVTGGPNSLTRDMQAALQTYTDADGGFAIPFTIDPSFILTSDGAVNPFRGIARIEQITSKAWQAVTTAGVTAAYAASEVTAATDAAPTDVAGPTATPVRAHIFIKFTAEYAEDYGAAAIQSELGGLVQDAKDVLEADKFVTGTGTNEPQGIVAAIVTDTTSLVTTITNDTYALGDIDKLETALGARFRARATFAANRAIYQRTRNFGVAGQPSSSIYDPMSKTLRGYPAVEATAMDDVATDAKKVLLLGDFRHFVIVDRIGLSTEYIPQVFDGDGKPLGQRGIYARWRNTSKVLTFNAFRLLKIQ